MKTDVGTTGRVSSAWPWAGTVAVLALVAAAFLVPPLADWQVWARRHPPPLPPLHGYWQVKVGPGTLPSLALAALALRYGDRSARRLGWPALLTVSYVVGLAWLVSLALVDGTDGLSRVLGDPSEYLRTARRVGDVHVLLQQYISRIPDAAGARQWPTHVAGHPPGMLLFFVGLVRIGLGGDLAAGLVVTAIAASLPLAVLCTLRALRAGAAARLAAPFLVFSPAAVFLAVSADAVMATTAAWGLACLAVATRHGPRSGWPWAAAAGLLLGATVMMSYGLPLLGFLALAVLVAARRWWPLPVAAAGAGVVVLGFAAGGFAWWQAYPVLVQRYWDGLASRRPGGYWTWANLAAFAVSAGPVVGPGVASLAAQARHTLVRPVVPLLVGAALVALTVADLSQMSRAEVERIWLPFVPWVTLAATALPPGWRRPVLAAQLATALLVQHLVYTVW